MLENQVQQAFVACRVFKASKEIVVLKVNQVIQGIKE